MNLFYRRINLFIISILFSVNGFAISVGKLFNGLSDWGARQSLQRSIKKNDGVSNFGLNMLSRAGRRESLDIINSGRENPLYSSVYSHLEQNPELVNVITDKGVKEATDILIIALVGMRGMEDGVTPNWIDLLWKAGDRDIFLRLWDIESAGPTIASFVRKEHLIDDPKLLLRYWQEKERVYYVGPEVVTLGDRLAYFIDSSLRGMDFPEDVSLHKGLEKFYNEDPFGKTLLRAFGESDDFVDEAQSLTEYIAQRVFHSEEPDNFERMYEYMLERGRRFDEVGGEASPFSEHNNYGGGLGGGASRIPSNLI